MEVPNLFEFTKRFHHIHQEAKLGFLLEYEYDLVLNSPRTGVDQSGIEGHAELHINPSCRLVKFFQDGGLSEREAWLLSLAHESGHFKLNRKCIDFGKDPALSDSQLEAIGIDSKLFLALPVSCHKETAIEAYCDACLAQEAVLILGPRWEMAIRLLANLRAVESSEIGAFHGDEYATAPMLQEILNRGSPIDPIEAAQIALEASIKNMGLLKQGLTWIGESLGAWRRGAQDKKEKIISFAKGP